MCWNTPPSLTGICPETGACYLLGVLELVVAVVGRGVEQKVLVVRRLSDESCGALLDSLPFRVVVQNSLVHPLCEAAFPAVLGRARDGIDENRGGDRTQGVKECSLNQLISIHLSDSVTTLPQAFGDTVVSKLRCGGCQCSHTPSGSSTP